MNENFTSNFDNLTNKSATVALGITPAELWIQLTIFYVLLAGVLSTLGNVLMTIGIIKSKDLRTRFFIIVGSLLITRSLISLEMGIAGVHRILRSLGVVEVNLKRYICHSIHFQFFYATTLEMILILVLVIDRVLAIAFCNYYRSLTRKQALVTCIIISVFIVISKIILSYLGVNMNDTIPCLNVYSAPHELFNLTFQNIDFAVTILILVLYVGLIMYVRFYLLKSMKSEHDGSKKIFLERQMKLLPMLRRLVLIHCGLAMFTKLLSLLAGVVTSQAARLTAYGGIMTTVDLFANVIMLLATNKELREASFPCWKSKVGPQSGIKVNTSWKSKP